MYYITQKDSETGKKFQAVKEKMEDIYQKQRKLAEKYGFSQWCGYQSQVKGNIKCVSFEDETKIDPKVWKIYDIYKGEKFYSPKLSSKVGKEINQAFHNLPVIGFEELNDCIGAFLFSNCIGFAWGEEYFGFTTKEEWDVEIPADCEEITFKRWKEIFKEE